MVFAIAALLFQVAPVVHVLPVAAAGSGTVAATSLAIPGRNAADVPANKVTSSNNLPDSASAQPSREAGASDGTAGEIPSGSLRAVSLDTSPQNSQSLSTIRVPDSQPAKQIPVVRVETMPSRRNWLILSAAQHSAAAFDAYSTRRALASGAVENNPIMRPFTHSPAIYGAIQIGPALLDFAARRMQRSQNRFVRHIWWLPQSVSTAAFLYSGVHNMHVANRPWV